MKTYKKNTTQDNIKGCMIVGCGALFYMYQYIIRVSPNVMNDELLANFVIDSAGLGVLLAAYNLSYSSMQIPLGITMDRLGVRFFLFAACLLCSIACFVFGNTTNPIIGGGARFLMGMGSACGLIGTIKLGTIWLEPKHVAKVTGVTILMGTLGAALGGAPLEVVLNKLGFERTMELLGFIGIVVSVLIYFFVSNKPRIDHHEEITDIYANQHPLKDVILLVKNRQAWLLAIYGMLMYLPITVIGVAWGVSFVQSVADVNEVIAGSVVSTMFFGAAFGSPIFAYFSDFIKNRRLPMIFGAIITTIIWSIILFIEMPLYMLYILFFVAGFTYTAKCLSFAGICETMPLKMSGVSIAFVNMVVMSAPLIFFPIIGFLLDFNWSGQLMNNIPFYTPNDYRFALMVLPISLGISAIIIFFIKETHPERKLPKEYGSVIDIDVI